MRVEDYVPPPHLRARFCVDFNSKKLFDVIRVGDPVIIFDGEGNECDASISEIVTCESGHRIVHFDPEPNSFRASA